MVTPNLASAYSAATLMATSAEGRTILVGAHLGGTTFAGKAVSAQTNAFVALLGTNGDVAKVHGFTTDGAELEGAAYGPSAAWLCGNVTGSIASLAGAPISPSVPGATEGFLARIPIQ